MEKELSNIGVKFNNNVVKFRFQYKMFSVLFHYFKDIIIL